jgi:predicted acylesterase/phospholipase RssA
MREAIEKDFARISPERIASLRQLLLGTFSPPTKLQPDRLYVDINVGQKDTLAATLAAGLSSSPSMHNTGWLHFAIPTLREMLRLRRPWSEILEEEKLKEHLNPITSSDLAIEILRLLETTLQRRLFIESLMQNEQLIPVCMPSFNQKGGQEKVESLLPSLLGCLDRKFPLLLSFAAGNVPCAPQVLNQFFELERHRSFELRTKGGVHHDKLVEVLASTDDHQRGYHIAHIHGDGQQHEHVTDLMKVSSVVFCHVLALEVGHTKDLKALGHLLKEAKVLYLVYSKDNKEEELAAARLDQELPGSQFVFLRLPLEEPDKGKFRLIYSSILKDNMKPSANSPLIQENRPHLAVCSLMDMLNKAFEQLGSDVVKLKLELFPLSCLEQSAAAKQHVMKKTRISPEEQQKELIAFKEKRSHYPIPHDIVSFLRDKLLTDPEIAREFGRELTAWNAPRIAVVKQKITELHNRNDMLRKEWSSQRNLDILVEFTTPPGLENDLAKAVAERDNLDIALGNFTRELLERARGVVTGRVFEDSKKSLLAAQYLADFCFSNGTGVELLDGDKMDLNDDYIQHLFTDITQQFKVIIVIGPQSSGKSFLENVLFGLHFATSAGKCTKGLHAAICTTNASTLVILDSEGLLSPERGDSLYDKKLALFAFALSSSVVVNVKGQALADISQLFNTLTYCFKELTLTNYRPELFMVLRDVETTHEARQTQEHAINYLWKKTKYKGVQLNDFVDYNPVKQLYCLPPAFIDEELLSWRTDEQRSIPLFRRKPNEQFFVDVVPLRRELAAADRKVLKQGTIPFPLKLKTWGGASINMWRNWIQPFCPMIDFKHVFMRQLEYVTAAAVDLALENTIEKDLVPVLRANIQRLCQAVEDRSETLETFSDADLLVPLDLSNSFQSFREKIVESLKLSATAENASELFSRLLQYFFEARSSLGSHLLVQSVALELFDGASNHNPPLDVLPEQANCAKERCFERLEDYCSHFRRMFRDNLSTSVTAMRIKDTIHSIRKVILSNTHNSQDQKVAKDQLLKDIDRLRDEWKQIHKPKQDGSLATELIQVTKKFESHESRLSFEALQDCLKSPKTEYYQELISWLKNKRESQEEEERHLGRLVSQQDPEQVHPESHLVSVVKQLIGDGHDNKNAANLHFLQRATSSLLEVLENPPYQDSADIAEYLKKSVGSMLEQVGMLESNNLVSRENLPEGQRPTELKPTLNVSNLVYGLWINIMLKNARIYGESSFRSKLTKVMEACNREKAAVELLVSHSDNAQTSAEELAPVLTNLLLAQRKGEVTEHLRGVFNVSRVEHKSATIAEEFYHSAFIEGRWELVWNFIEKPIETLKKWFYDVHFKSSFLKELTQEETKLRTSFQEYLAKVVRWKDTVLASIEGRTLAVEKGVVLCNFVHFLYFNRYPKGKEPGAQLTELLKLPTSDAGNQLPKSVIDLPVFQEQAKTEDVALLVRSLSAELFSQLQKANLNLVINEPEEQQIFEKYYRLCRKCSSCCYYCGAICVADHSGTKKTEHKAYRHLLVGYRGYCRQSTRLPHLYSCLEEGFSTEFFPTTHKSFTKHRETFHPDWVPDLTEITKAKNHDELDNLIRTAFVQLYPLLQGRFGFAELSSPWKELYEYRSRPRSIPRSLRFRQGSLRRLQRSGRVLALDGGGLRGLMTLRQLENLEKRTGLEVWQMFDLIVGTSVGSVIAAAIGILHWNSARCIKLLTTVAKQVFPETGKLKKIWNIGTRGGAFQADKLRGILKDNFGPYRLLRESEGQWPKVAIVAARTSTSVASTFVFRTYDPFLVIDDSEGINFPYEGNSEVTIWEAVLASASAPTYFPPVKISIDGTEHIFVDGGIVANNPAEIGVHESKVLFKPLEEGHHPVKVLVSIGTGKQLQNLHPEAEAPKFSILSTALSFAPALLKQDYLGSATALVSSLGSFAIKKVAHEFKKNINPGMLIDLISESESVHNNLLQSNQHFAYFRFNPGDLGNREMDDSRDVALTLLDTVVKVYLHSAQEDLRKCSTKLQASRLFLSTNEQEPNSLVLKQESPSPDGVRDTTMYLIQFLSGVDQSQRLVPIHFVKTDDPDLVGTIDLTHFPGPGKLILEFKKTHIFNSPFSIL